MRTLILLTFLFGQPVFAQSTFDQLKSYGTESLTQTSAFSPISNEKRQEMVNRKDLIRLSSLGMRNQIVIVDRVGKNSTEPVYPVYMGDTFDNVPVNEVILELSPQNKKILASLHYLDIRNFDVDPAVVVNETGALSMGLCFDSLLRRDKDTDSYLDLTFNVCGEIEMAIEKVGKKVRMRATNFVPSKILEKDSLVRGFSSEKMPDGIDDKFKYVFNETPQSVIENALSFVNEVQVGVLNTFLNESKNLAILDNVLKSSVKPTERLK